MNFWLPIDKKIYFASDLHLSPLCDDSRKRELEFVKWLDSIKNDAVAVFLLGDIFDFWFEYKNAVPQGFVRLLGKIAELTDMGIEVHFFVGNHDQWLSDYLKNELNIVVHNKRKEIKINNKLFMIGHGHCISRERVIDNILHSVFANSFAHILFAAIHPRWSVAFANKWAIKHRKKHGLIKPFTDWANEPIFKYAQDVLTKKHYDFFVFGHRHLAAHIALNGNSQYINTGEWIEAKTYAVFDGNDMKVANFCSV